MKHATHMSLKLTLFMWSAKIDQQKLLKTINYNLLYFQQLNWYLHKLWPKALSDYFNSVFTKNTDSKLNCYNYNSFVPLKKSPKTSLGMAKLIPVHQFCIVNGTCK